MKTRIYTHTSAAGTASSSFPQVEARHCCRAMESLAFSFCSNMFFEGALPFNGEEKYTSLPMAMALIMVGRFISLFFLSPWLLQSFT